MPRSSFTGSDPFPGLGIQENQQVGVLPVPALYFSHRVSSRFAWGIGLHAPYGLKTKWANPDQFTGRYIAVESSLSGFALNPTVAVRRPRQGLGGRGARPALLEGASSCGARALVDPYTQKVTDTAEVVARQRHGDGGRLQRGGRGEALAGPRRWAPTTATR